MRDRDEDSIWERILVGTGRSRRGYHNQGLLCQKIIFFFSMKKGNKMVSKVMAQGLNIHVIITEELGSVFPTHMVAPNSYFWGIGALCPN